MTILFFSRLFYPHIGGVEKHVLEISKILVKNGYKIIIFTEQFDRKLKLYDTTAGIDIYRISVGKDNWFKKFRIWRELWKYRNLIRGANVVHCHDVFFWYFPFRFLFPNKPVFTTFHGYETKFPPAKFAILIRKISEKLSFGNICVGDYIKKWYGTTPTFVTYGGVEIRNSKFEIRNKFKTQISKPKIVFIGRLEEDTGALIYLKALELMRQKKIDFEFEACGDGFLKRSVEQYGKVHGFLKDLKKYIERADIVFTSSYLSILEVMKHKKLVFAVYDNPLKEDYLKMAPFAKWIVVENSLAKVVEKIEYFIKQFEEKEKALANAYQWASKQTWGKVADIYLRLWRRF